MNEIKNLSFSTTPRFGNFARTFFSIYYGNVYHALKRTEDCSGPTKMKYLRNLEWEWDVMGGATGCTQMTDARCKNAKFDQRLAYFKKFITNTTLDAPTRCM